MKGKRLKSVSYAKYGYIFSIPFVLAFLIFTAYPIFYTAIIGFTDLKGLGKTDFTILETVSQFPVNTEEPIISKIITEYSHMWTINFIPQILLALLLTAWFTNQRQKLRGQGAFKVLFYMPISLPRLQ